MNQSFSTEHLPDAEATRRWRGVISDALFELDVSFPDDRHVLGLLDQWEVASCSLSWLVSNGLNCRRLRRHCRGEDPEILLTIPVQNDVEFSQLGRTARCSPGQYVLELGEEPYEFGCGSNTTMWVLKAPVQALKARVGEPQRYSARQCDASQGVGLLFSDYLQLMTRHCRRGGDPGALPMMGDHLLDLLALSLRQHPDALQSQLSAVRDAHLARIDEYVRRHLTDPDLSPASIARECGISLRYLHVLFRESSESVAQWIRDLRLQAAHEALRRVDRPTSIAEVAYAVGFSDHAQFSNAFRKKFGHPPRELLRSRRAG